MEIDTRFHEMQIDDSSCQLVFNERNRTANVSKEHDPLRLADIMAPIFVDDDGTKYYHKAVLDKSKVSYAISSSMMNVYDFNMNLLGSTSASKTNHCLGAYKSGSGLSSKNLVSCYLGATDKSFTLFNSKSSPAPVRGKVASTSIGVTAAYVEAVDSNVVNLYWTE